MADAVPLQMKKLNALSKEGHPKIVHDFEIADQQQILPAKQNIALLPYQQSFRIH